MLEFKNLMDRSFVKRMPSGGDDRRKGLSDIEEENRRKKKEELRRKNKKKRDLDDDSGKKDREKDDKENREKDDKGKEDKGGKGPIFKPCIYYLREQLDETEKKAYDDILTGLLAMKGTIDTVKIPYKSIPTVMRSIFYDHPELFWYKGHYSFSNKDDATEINPKYLYDKKERDKRQKVVDAAVNEFFAGINEKMSEYERLKAVYEYVILRVEYELGCPDNQNIYSVFANKKSVCAGYARSFQYLLQKMGFECIYVVGPVNVEGYHAWNIVKCNGNYYQVDSTWGDMNYGRWKNRKPVPKELSIEYAYLCCTDKQMYEDRKPDMPAEMPACTATDLNYYKMHGRYFMVYCDNVRRTMEEDLKKGQNFWKAQFSCEREWQKTYDEIAKGMFGKCARNHGIKGSTYFLRNPRMKTIICYELPEEL